MSLIVLPTFYIHSVYQSIDVNECVKVGQSNLYLQSHNLEPLFEKFWPNIGAQETLRKSIISEGLLDKPTKIYKQNLGKPSYKKNGKKADNVRFGRPPP